MKRLARSMGMVVCVAGALSAAVATAAPTGGFFFADGFDRPDSTDMGPYWVEQWSDWRVEGNEVRTAPGYKYALMTVDGYELAEPILEVTIRHDGTIRPTYVALVCLYLDDANNIFVKVQDNDLDGLYDTAWFYRGNNREPWGDRVPGRDDWEDLWPYFSEARMGTYITGDEVVLGIDRDFDGVFESLYARGGVPLAELGLGVGLGGYNDAQADNFLAVPEPATLALMGLGAAVLVATRRKHRV
ncbi:MAG TPA: PEP-CTERM sorting domain-containing protein [Phycisphaerae bacterium]|nr:PEP-CTERM sorting domain-containing protein [Phycisphaerae bacterium]